MSEFKFIKTIVIIAVIYGRNKGVKQAVEALQKILEEREEVTIKLSDGRIKTFKATSVK